MIFSKILEMDGKIEIGDNFLRAMDPIFYEMVLPLQFSFFLGKMPVFRDWLRVIVIASIRGSLIYCNNFVDNPSGPVLCLVSSSLIILVTVVIFVGPK